MNRSREIGKLGEHLAYQYLLTKGLRFLERNWRSAEGEIDLVMQDGEAIVFVEVKTRTTHEFGWPEESITRSKRLRLQRVALAYLEANDQLHDEWRIDVIAIDLSHTGSVDRFEHIMHAIEEES
jgi:putative endonuclease